MLQQVTQPLLFGAQFHTQTDGTAKTGLSVSVAVHRVALDGTITTSMASGSAIEVAGGEYQFRLASPAVAGLYVAVFSTSDTSVVLRSVASRLWVGVAGIQSLDAAVSTLLASSSYVAPDNAGIASAVAQSTAARTASEGNATSLTTILSRLGAITGSGLNTVLGYFRALASKNAGLTPSDLTGGGNTFDNTTDSLEALRDRGDAAWTTGGGGGGGSSSTLVVQGPFSITSESAGPDGGVVAYSGDAINLLLVARDGEGDPINLAGGTLSALLVSAAGFSQTPAPTTTALWAEGGTVRVGLVVPTAPGRYRLTIRRTNGTSDITTYGPLTLVVRAR
jgi:hypothetical protein